jgi:hypothetical protein
MQNLEIAISNSGPEHELHVYIRASGEIIWRAHAQGDEAKHLQLLEEAEQVVQTTNALLRGKLV